MSHALNVDGITWREIHGQPALWRNIANQFSSRQPALEAFFSSLPPGTEAIHTGAGSSAFVGESVAALFEEKTRIPSRAVATTDLVTHPNLFFRKRAPLLLVSYARSGNSPESVAAVKLADQLHSDVYHLVLTCNAEGALALRSQGPRTCLVLLPPEANDQGLAMIGSVTGMILAALLIADRVDKQALARVLATADQGQKLLESIEVQKRCGDIAASSFERLVCLGSGPLLGVAREAHLKVQELSDGRVIGKFDSFLGFRHGPKAVVNEKTLLLYFASADGYVKNYELDLMNGIRKDMNPLGTLSLAPDAAAGLGDPTIALDPEGKVFDPAYLLPLYLLPAQLIAVLKSSALGLNPDSPSPRGAIHRVVQGVTIYPFGGAD